MEDIKILELFILIQDITEIYIQRDYPNIAIGNVNHAIKLLEEIRNEMEDRN